MKAPRPTPSAPKVLVPAGTHLAVLYSMMDMGTQTTEFAGEKKKQRKLRLSFELPKKRADFDGVSKPMAIHKELGFTMFSKGNLRTYAEALLGRALQDKEADNLDVETLLGKAVLATVLHEKGPDGITRAKFKGVAPLMEGIDAPAPENKVVFYSVTQGSTALFQSLPNWLQEKLAIAPEFDSGSDEALASDDIPF